MEETTSELRNVSIKKVRNSSFEILRIIAILLIIASHFSVHGHFVFTGSPNSIIFNKIWLDLLVLGNIGVNLFVLISGYFLIDNNKFRIKKVLTLILEMLTFSIIIGIIFIIAGQKEITWSLIKTILFPVGSRTWGFMTTYLIIYILSPFLNRGIRAMNRKIHLTLIAILLVIWSILPTLVLKDYDYSSFGWFITLYLISSYIKIYDINLKIKPYFGILISIGIYLFYFFLKWGITLAFDSNNDFVEWFTLSRRNNFFQVCCTVLLFMSFKNIHIRSSRAINLIASTTMAIYLFHDHPEVRSFLWVNIFKNPTYTNSPYLFLYSLACILAVFSFGVLIGLAYRYSFSIGYDKILKYFDEKWLYRVDEFLITKKKLILLQITKLSR